MDNSLWDKALGSWMLDGLSKPLCTGKRHPLAQGRAYPVPQKLNKRSESIEAKIKKNDTSEGKTLENIRTNA